LGDLATLRSSLNNLAYLQRREGQLPQAAESYRQALQVAERVGDPSIIAFARFVLGRVCLERGEWGEARGLFEQALSAALSAGSSWYSSYALAGLGCLYLLEGEREQGLRLLEEAIATAERNEDVQGLFMHTFVAQQEVLDGRPDAAVTRLERVRQRTQEAGREVFHWQLPWALLEAGDEGRAAALLERFDEGMLFEARIELPHVLRVSAMLARRQNRWEDAEGDLVEALGMTRAMGMPYNEALVLQEYGHLQVARGEPDDARTRLEAALAIFQRLGARPDIERTEQLLSGLS
jgi:tetratricopeptide (TPR) repeat protein